MTNDDLSISSTEILNPSIKYYFASYYYFKSGATMFSQTYLKIHPLQWQKDKNETPSRVCIINWQEISKDEYTEFKSSAAELSVS